eukprot:Hpha_TRINITY_DN31398_c0_g1::TRINITY_DN31398_c0_g1_i1::g.194556::m.194556
MVDPARFSAWLEQQQRAPEGGEVLRCKGLVAVAGREERYVFNGVGDAFSGGFAERWRPGESRRCRVVFIGRGLQREKLEGGLRSCLLPPLRFRRGDRVRVPTVGGAQWGREERRVQGTELGLLLERK